MKVLLNDGMDMQGIALLEEAGFQTDTEHRSLEALIRDIGEFGALVVRGKTKVGRDVFEAGKKLIAVGRAGVGYDNIDVEAAADNGIVVLTAPHGNTNATAELAIDLMGSCLRNIPYAHQSLKRGKWDKAKYAGRELSGKTVGIIGCGRIGQRVAELLKGYATKTIACDPVKYDNPNISEYVELDELLQRSDIVTIHSSQRDRIIGIKELLRMKPTAYLILTSRAVHVDSDALYNALDRKQIAGAGVDVYDNEPTEDGVAYTNKLLSLDNAICTSHLGASTMEAERNTSIEIAQAVVDYLLKGDFSKAVNIERGGTGAEKYEYLHVFHEDVPGAWADIFQVLKNNGINIRENPSGVPTGGGGNAKTAYRLLQAVDEKVLAELEALKVVHWARMVD